jgi:hypothetical protein
MVAAFFTVALYPIDHRSPILCGVAQLSSKTLGGG